MLLLLRYQDGWLSFPTPVGEVAASTSLASDGLRPYLCRILRSGRIYSRSTSDAADLLHARIFLRANRRAWACQEFHSNSHCAHYEMLFDQAAVATKQHRSDLTAYPDELLAAG